ncbi:unnamed protein product, partial [Prunus brigantina]
KAEVKSPRTQATSSRARNLSPLRKKPKLPSAEKIQVGVVPASSARVKHLVGADSKKIGGMRNIRDAHLKPLADEFGDHDLLREVVPHLLKGKEMQIFLSEVQVACTSRGMESLQIPLEVRLAEARKARESSARAKDSSATSAADPKVDKSSTAGDAGVSDLLKTHFLSSPSSCSELVDQIRQAGDLGTFSSLSLEKKREATLHLLQKGVVFATETIRNSSASYVVDLASRKDAYFCLERKNADLSHNYDKLLAKFHAYHRSVEESKSEATMDAYKLGYLDCKNGYDPFYAIGDEDIEMLYPDLPSAQSEEANAMNTEGAEEQMAEEAVAEEDGAEEDAVDEVVVDVIDQACRGAESAANRVDTKEAADHGSPTGISE